MRRDLSVWTYERLARLLPASFRSRHGLAVNELFVERLEQERRSGRLAATRFTARALMDLGAASWRLRSTASNHRSSYAHHANGGLHGRSNGSRGGAPHDPRNLWTLDMLLNDLRYAIRSLLWRPSFTAIVVFTLAIGIGANASIYSIIDTVVFNPFDFPEPDRVVSVGSEYPRINRQLSYFEHLSAPDFADIAERSTKLEHMVAFDMGNRRLSGGDRPTNFFTAFWWGDGLEPLGMRPHLGRGFSASDVLEREPVALISHRVWQSRFAADPDAVGSTVRINDDPYTLIGVLPPGVLIFGTDLWMPMWAAPEAMPRDRRQFAILARIADNATVAEANVELEELARRTEAEFAAEFEAYEGWGLRVATWRDVNVGQFQTAAYVLLGAVGFVLLLVCANVASLLLSRSATRQREMALRTALGAGRIRLLRQLLTESAVLAAAGTLVGLAFAKLETAMLVARIPQNLLPTDTAIGINSRVLLFTMGISLLAAVVFGLAPSLYASRVNLRSALTAGAGRASAGSLRRRWHGAFVTIEVALALALLMGAGLLLNSFLQLNRVDPGVDPNGVLTMRITLPWERYEGSAISDFFLRLAENVEEIPGVETAASGAQFAPIGFLRQQFAITEGEVLEDSALPSALSTIASADYFETLGIPLREGRLFNNTDEIGAPFAFVVNRTLAERFFPAGDALGREIRLGTAESPGETGRILGIVNDTRNRGLQVDTQPELYASLRQASGVFNQIYLILRIADGVEPRSVLPAVRAAVSEIDADQPVYNIQTLDEAFSTGFATQGLAMQLLSVFAGFALLIAAIGVYGVVSYAVAERTREIGVRMALGAGSGSVRKLIVRQALLPVSIGVVLGVAMSIGLGRAMSGLLFGVGGGDPWTLAIVTAVLGTIALLASYVPARRASATDPVVALRSS